MASSSSTTNKTITSQANTLWQKQPKANAEFFALTYGALVAELIRDLEQTPEIQAELDRMGHSMGIRFIEEVLAKAPELKVSNQFMETVDVVKVAFKLFLGVTVEIYSEEEKKDQYTVKMNENPLMIFVELPEDRQDLEYSQLLAGLLRGMLEMLQFDCHVTISSTLVGKEVHELQVTLKQVLQGGAGEEYQEE